VRKGKIPLKMEVCQGILGKDVKEICWALFIGGKEIK